MEPFLKSQKLERHILCVRARLHVHAMRVGARTCAHVCVRTFLDVFAPKFVKTSPSVSYMLFSCALACAHYARTMHVRALHACAHSHVIGRILSKFDEDIHWVKTSLSVGYMHFTCALACAHYARNMRVRALHAYARSHILGRTLSILGATFYGSQKVA
jgi:hypothetical protein